MKGKNETKNEPKTKEENETVWKVIEIVLWIIICAIGVVVIMLGIRLFNWVDEIREYMCLSWPLFVIYWVVMLRVAWVGLGIALNAGQQIKDVSDEGWRSFFSGKSSNDDDD